MLVVTCQCGDGAYPHIPYFTGVYLHARLFQFGLNYKREHIMLCSRVLIVMGDLRFGPIVV